MAVLTLSNDNPEYQTFPPILKEYASYSVAIKGISQKAVCEYLLDLRTFFRYYLTEKKRNKHYPGGIQEDWNFGN